MNSLAAASGERVLARAVGAHDLAVALRAVLDQTPALCADALVIGRAKYLLGARRLRPSRSPLGRLRATEGIHGGGERLHAWNVEEGERLGCERADSGHKQRWAGMSGSRERRRVV